MKNFLVVFSFLVLFGCNPADTKSSFEQIATIKVIGSCRDLENPSIYKDADSYDVFGTVSIWTTTREIGYDTIGSFAVTAEDINKRWNSIDFNNVDLNTIDAITDTPSIEIYEIPSSMVIKDTWSLPSVHNFDDTGEELSIYAAKKGECDLKVTERQGEIPSILLKKETWCLDPECTFNEIRDTYN